MADSGLSYSWPRALTAGAWLTPRLSTKRWSKASLSVFAAVGGGDRVARPDVGDAGCHADSLRGPQQDGGVRERLPVRRRLAEPDGAVAGLLDALHRRAFLRRRQRGDRPEPDDPRARSVRARHPPALSTRWSWRVRVCRRGIGCRSMLEAGRLLAAVAALAALALAPTAAFGAEAEVGATGAPFRGTDASGAVRGDVDAHLHITANQRAGGRVIYGEPFDPRGIEAALGDDASEHGPDGSADITGNLLRSGLPFGTHDTHGWPTFAGWPVNDTNTHQQIYYRWLERVWMAGE